jgi:hypothetical protein
MRIDAEHLRRFLTRLARVPFGNFFSNGIPILLECCRPSFPHGSGELLLEFDRKRGPLPGLAVTPAELIRDDPLQCRLAGVEVLGFDCLVGNS